MLFLPPGSAKSTYATVVSPTWAMGKWPGFKVIGASYGSDLMRKFGRRMRSIVKQQAFTALFGTNLSSESSAADEWALENGSEFMGGGILSGITGNRADFIPIDDPIKGRQEADSEVTRQRTVEAYQDDILTRLKPGGSLMLTQTRWNEGDLAGAILPEDYKGESGMIECRDGNTWEVICIPAQAERADDASQESTSGPSGSPKVTGTHSSAFHVPGPLYTNSDQRQTQVTISSASGFTLCPRSRHARP
jgi:hypothetical protein